MAGQRHYGHYTGGNCDPRAFQLARQRSEDTARLRARREDLTVKTILAAAFFGAALGVASPSMSQGTDSGAPATTAPAQPPAMAPEGGAAPQGGGMAPEAASPAGETAGAAPGGFITRQEANQVHASSLMDADVVGSDDQRIGEVDDMILDENGRVLAVTVDVGGFLGIGQKTVAIPIEAVQFVPSDSARAAGTDPGTTASTTDTAPTEGAPTNGTTTGRAASERLGTTGSGFNWGGGELEFVKVDFTRDELQNAPAFEGTD